MTLTSHNEWSGSLDSGKKTKLSLDNTVYVYLALYMLGTETAQRTGKSETATCSNWAAGRYEL